MRIKLYLFGLIIAIIVGTGIALVYNAIRFPLSRRAIQNKMSDENVVNISEYHGVIVYVLEVNDGYTAYVFIESMIINRFRLYWRPQYNYEQHGAASFSIPGKRNNVIVRFNGRDISFLPPHIYNTTVAHPRIRYFYFNILMY